MWVKLCGSGDPPSAVLSTSKDVLLAGTIDPDQSICPFPSLPFFESGARELISPGALGSGGMIAWLAEALCIQRSW